MLASTARFNSLQTNGSFKLIPAVEVRVIASQAEAFAAAQAEGRYIGKPNWEVLGECGHRLEVVREHEAPAWAARIEAKRRHRKRCDGCPSA